MRKNRSKYASKNYPNLYRLPDSPFWQFRKYSSEKGQEFKFSTGEAKNEAKAYKLGQDAFNDWLGRFAGGSRNVTIRELALEILESKSSKKRGTQRSTKNQIKNHIIPTFGYLRPDQMNSLRWDQYDARERARQRVSQTGKILKPRAKLFNTRKALMEILNRAEELGYIKRIPELKNHDPAPEPPRYLDRQTVRRILRHTMVAQWAALDPALDQKLSPTKLLAFIMWKQGTRPTEALQYRFSMIKWNEGPHGTIHIPGSITKTGRSRSIPLNSRVSRVLRWLQPRLNRDLLFPSRHDPEKAQAEYDQGWKRARDRAFAAMDQENAKIGQPPVPADLRKATIYNLRDSMITDCLLRGLSSTFIARYVDNSATMIEKKYAVAVKHVMERVAG